MHSMKFNLLTFSDDALRSIAAGKNPEMSQRAKEILETRKFPVVRNVPQEKRGG